MRHTSGIQTLIAAAVTVALPVSCDRPPGDDASARGPTATLAVVGQALIEHDPRVYLEAPLATVLPILDSADAVFTNLEVAVNGPGCHCSPTRDDVFFHGAGPEVLDYLRGIGVSLLSLANNHSWDYGDAGIVSTLEEAARRRFAHAGTGRTVAHAVAPAYRRVGGLRIGLVAVATVNAPPGAMATDTETGVNLMAPGDAVAWDRNISAIRHAAANSDILIAYHHYQVDAGPGWQEQWARAAVDAGADLYVSHGEPRLAGVEAYGGGLILYGLGNFIFHSRTEIGNYPPEVWESAVVTLSVGKDGVHEAVFTPVVLDEGTPGELFFETRGYPEVAEGEAADGILRRLAEMSAEYGTVLEVRDGRAYWRSERPGGVLRTAAEFMAAVESVQDPRSDGLDQYTLEGMMEKRGLPGVSVAVIHDFEVHAAKGYGVADVETGAAVDTETVFQAASISKPVAAMAVMKAVQDGRFSLDEDINGILTSHVLTPTSVLGDAEPRGRGSVCRRVRIEKEGEGWYFSHTGGNWGFRALLKAHRAKGYGHRGDDQRGPGVR